MNLPKSWSEVTIDTFLRYYTISQSKFNNLIGYEVELLAIFSGQPVSEIEKLKPKDIVKCSKQLSFLKTLPQTKIHAAFKIDGVTYKPCLLTDDMLGGQFMHFTEILKSAPDQQIYQMPYLIASMCKIKERGLFIERGKVMLSRYTYNHYNGVGDTFKAKLTMDKAYPLFVFFCAIMQKLYPAIQTYLTKELIKINPKMKKEINRLLKDSQPIGHGL